MATERRQRSANGYYYATLPEVKWWRRYVLLFCAGASAALTGGALRWDWLVESALLVFFLPLVFTLRSTAVGKNRACSVGNQSASRLGERCSHRTIRSVLSDCIGRVACSLLGRTVGFVLSAERQLPL